VLQGSASAAQTNEAGLTYHITTCTAGHAHACNSGTLPLSQAVHKQWVC